MSDNPTTPKPSREAASIVLEAAADAVSLVSSPGYTPTSGEHAMIANLAALATGHALLAIEARLGEVVEQQKLANVIAAFDAIEGDGHPLEMGSGDVHAAIFYIHAATGDIVNPDPGSKA